MKTRLHLLLTMLLSVSFIKAQEISINTSMGANYSKQVFYKLSTESELLLTLIYGTLQC